MNVGNSSERRIKYTNCRVVSAVLTDIGVGVVTYLTFKGNPTTYRFKISFGTTLSL